MTKVSQLKTARQLGFDARSKFSDSALLIIQLCKTLPAKSYTLFVDNFFSSIKLFKALRTLGIAACGTAKKGSGFPKELLAIRDVATKTRDWGRQASMIIDDEVLCMSWIDNNAVQYMTTSHSLEDLTKIHYLHERKRAGIPKDSAQPIIHYNPSIIAHSAPIPGQQIPRPMGLPVPQPIRDYNLHMGGSDGNAQ